MDISSVMSSYDMSSLWNTLNSSSNSSSQLDTVEAASLNSQIQQQNAAISGTSSSTQADNIMKSVDPYYSITNAYDALTSSVNSSTSSASSTTSSASSVTSTGENIPALLQQSLNTSGNVISQDVMAQYIGIEDGTLQSTVTNLLSSNPTTVYNSISSLGNATSQNLVSLIDTTV